MANVKPQTFNPDNVMMHEHKEGVKRFQRTYSFRCIAKF